MTDGHLVFVWTPTGYELREHEGEPPQLGATVEEDGKRLRVAKLAPSPFPRDERVCAYLLAT
jgi:hypothetical protein